LTPLPFKQAASVGIASRISCALMAHSFIELVVIDPAIRTTTGPSYSEKLRIIFLLQLSM
jgi:hypothetical protein